jgi:hypothetical protein
MATAAGSGAAALETSPHLKAASEEISSAIVIRARIKMTAMVS